MKFEFKIFFKIKLKFIRKLDKNWIKLELLKQSFCSKKVDLNVTGKGMSRCFLQKIEIYINAEVLH